MVGLRGVSSSPTGPPGSATPSVGQMDLLVIGAWALLGAGVAATLRPIATHLSRAEGSQESIAPRGLLEIVTAVLVGALAWRLNHALEVIAFALLAAVSVSLAAVDLQTGRLPNRLVATGYVLASVFLIVAAVAHDDTASLWRAIGGLAVTVGFYASLYLLMPHQLGGGDVKFAGLLGLASGWVSWQTVLASALVTWCSAALVILLRSIILRRHRLTLPLGPFLMLGTFMAILAAGQF